MSWISPRALLLLPFLVVGCAADRLEPPLHSGDAGAGDGLDGGFIDDNPDLGASDDGGTPDAAGPRPDAGDVGSPFDAEVPDGEPPCAPSAELCDGEDNDCDGDIDEGTFNACGACGPTPREVCDGVDNDCDGQVDEDCVVCEPSAEVCDGADNDCDGLVDAADPDLLQQGGTCGAGVCQSVAPLCMGALGWRCEIDDPAHEPSGETLCDGLDNDCDGDTDESLERGCATVCGAGVERCSRGRWRACDAPQPRAEVCDGRDNDCDGQVDEALTRSCSTACGSGVEVCQGGRFQGCDAPQPQTEVCDGRDNDCNGRVDDGLGHELLTVTVAQLTAEHETCQAPTFDVDHCHSATNRLCAARGCQATGAGPVAVNGDRADIICVARGGVVRSVPFDELAAIAGVGATEPFIDHRQGMILSHRYCVSQGFEVGLGPLEHNNGVAFIYCVPASLSSAETVTRAQIAARGCDLDGDADDVACAGAAHTLCRDRGFLAGIGPVDWDAQAAVLGCLR